jgi:PAS domain S-box-containing protein
VLLVDDRVENLVALEAVLQPEGYRLVRATSGAEALKHVLRQDFAVILLDVQMPVMNGFETAQLIKSRERSRHTPIIFLTAISKEEEYVFEGYSAGAVDYLFKPFNPYVLRSKVAVFADLYRKTQQIREQAKALRESELREQELEHEAELRQSEERWALILSSAMDAIITFGEDRHIRMFNEAACAMFGYTAEQALQLTIDALLHPPIPQEKLDAQAGAQQRGGAHPEELHGVRSNGTTFPIEASFSCLVLPEERVYTVIAHDVTQQHQARQRLREQTQALQTRTQELHTVNAELEVRQQELERAMTSRSRFFASMSHELRTPINAMLGYTALLLDGIYGELTDAQRNGIVRANKAAQHLLELVNDVLDLSKIEAGKLELQFEPVTLPDLVQDLFVTMTPLAEQHNTQLTLTPAESFGIITDSRRLRQIVLNLLSNAIKFGRGQPVVVTCRPLADGGAEIEVRDCGIGIPEADQERIFMEFEQLEPPQATQGTGLGLPISRRLAVLLGGSLNVTSSLGAGATFTLQLPRMTTELAESENALSATAAQA